MTQLMPLLASVKGPLSSSLPCPPALPCCQPTNHPHHGLQPMSVSLAKFEQKGNEYVAKQDPRQKRAKKKVLQKLEKDLGWTGFDDILKPQQVSSYTWAAGCIPVFTHVRRGAAASRGLQEPVRTW